MMLNPAWLGKHERKRAALSLWRRSLRFGAYFYIEPSWFICSVPQIESR